VFIETISTNWNKARQVNSTASSFSTKIPTATRPTTADAGDATSQVALLMRNDKTAAPVQNGMRVVPFGTGSDTNTFSLAVIGWAHCDDPLKLGYTPTRLWVPTLLVLLSCELDSGLPGIAGTTIDSTQYFVSTITLTYGDPGVSVDIVSPGHGNGWIAHALLDFKGFPIVEPAFSTGGSATDCNALWGLM
jgi:hypothetical protein